MGASDRGCKRLFRPKAAACSVRVCVDQIAGAQMIIATKFNF